MLFLTSLNLNQMKQVLAFILFIISPVLFAQEESQESRFNAGVSIRTNYNGLTFIPSGIGERTPDLNLGYGILINLNYSITDFFRLTTGIGYGRKNLSYEHTGLILPSDIDPMTGILSESRLEYGVPVNEIQIPLIMQTKPNSIGFFSFAGLEFAYQIAGKNDERIIHYGNGETERLTSPIDSDFNYSLVAGFGFRLPFIKKMECSVAPFVQYYAREGVIISESHQYSFGLNLIGNFNRK